MALSRLQKLRLQQLQIPLWELRVSDTSVSDELSNIEQNNNSAGGKIAETKTPLTPLKQLMQRGDNASVFWLLDSENSLPPEQFINDVSIAIQGHGVNWQVLFGSQPLLLEKLATDATEATVVVYNSRYKTVSLEAKTDFKILQIPVETQQDPKLKKQLWGVIYPSL